MKTLICTFSGFKIHPGHGIRFVRLDSKVCDFINNKSQQFFKTKKNPRNVHWTLIYRKINKKGIVEEEKRRKTRRTTKMQRAVVGASLEAIRAKRTQGADVRQAQRDAALRQIKERKKAQTVTKAEKKAKSAAVKAGGQQKGGQKAKQPKANVGRVGGKR